MIARAAALCLCFAANLATASAEPYSPWNDDPFWERPSRQQFDRYQDDRTRPVPQRQQEGGEQVRDGGARPAIAPQNPPVVAFNYPEYTPGSIVIDSGGRRLYFVLPGGRAFQYPISVGREGFAWAGTEKISRKQAWPDWHPPAEMRQRDPKLPEKMLGGLRNPLGAMALYLGNTLYRIHGTNDEKTIGRASSSGCFRMMNSAVLHLAQFAQIGTSVTVVNALPNAPMANPPVASARPASPAPPLATSRPAPRLAPPPSVAEDPDEPYEQRRNARDEDDEPETANVTITPRSDPDYFPQRTYERRRYGRARFDDPYAERPYSYDRYENRRRAWYDDERDDY